MPWQNFYFKENCVCVCDIRVEFAFTVGVTEIPLRENNVQSMTLTGGATWHTLLWAKIFKTHFLKSFNKSLFSIGHNSREVLNVRNNDKSNLITSTDKN